MNFLISITILYIYLQRLLLIIKQKSFDKLYMYKSIYKYYFAKAAVRIFRSACLFTDANAITATNRRSSYRSLWWSLGETGKRSNSNSRDPLYAGTRVVFPPSSRASYIATTLRPRDKFSTIRRHTLVRFCSPWSAQCSERERER